MSKLESFFGISKDDLLSAFAFILGVVNTAAAYQWYRNIKVDTRYPLSVSPTLMIVVSLFWAIVFFITSAMIYRHNNRFRKALVWLIPLFGLYRIILILGFVRSSYVRSGWVLNAVAWGLVSILVAGLVLVPSRRKSNNEMQ